MLYSGQYALFGSITRVNNFLASVLILKIFYFQVGGAVGGGTLQRREEKLRQWSVARARGTILERGPLSGPPLTTTSVWALSRCWAPSRAAIRSRGFQDGTPTPQTHDTRAPLLKPTPPSPPLAKPEPPTLHPTWPRLYPSCKW